MDWLESLYSMTLVPSAVFFLNTNWQTQLDRTLKAHASLDYWESGMDLGLSRDWFESYLKYQRRMSAEFKKLAGKYDFITINGNRSVSAVDRDLRARIEQILAKEYPAASKI